MKRLPALAALAASACLALTACTSASDLKTDDAASSGTSAGTSAEIPSFDVSGIAKQDDIAAMLPESISSDGKLTIGVSADYPPAEFLDTSNQPVGYDIDLSRALAAVLGLEATAQHAEFDSIIPSIGSKYDLGISSFTITPEREASTEMVSYISVGSQFNVAKGNPTGLDLSDTLGLCGKTVGVQTGTAQEEDIQGFNEDCQAAGKDAIDIKSYALNSDATTALAGGTLDAVFSDSTVAGYAQIQTGGAVETAGKVFDAAPQGIVIAKGDEATAKAIQAAVQYLMDEGIWNDILTSWGVDTSQALTTAEINPAV
ncbi:ABC transporter substrate-binding protein [uncultured Actinomyces sp.]|uniref:ABC transporter substrate-binding protein n=1 Tax=uncultured Actinomyces sp. TaxID=249061 RepID=UPI00280542E6|nr:ABC transporter substrate-binding protein [uncultured Actinomyces sp.]